MDELASSEARLLELVRGLSEEQWSFRETPERWSIAENVEHLVVFEGFIRGMIAKTLEGRRSRRRVGWPLRKNTWFLGWGRTEVRSSRLGRRRLRWAAGRTGSS
ncbi:DinB family protein [Tunturiibacter empetritectus]|uniref:DinB family protein n=1 Tax=Tunturiibacter empetritectus TaxID=3069691 RepID=UPI003D9BB067